MIARTRLTLPSLAVILTLASCFLFCPTARAAAFTLEDSVNPFYNVTERFLDVLQPYNQAILLNDVLTIVLNGTGATISAGNSSQPHFWQSVISTYWQNMMGYFLLVCFGIFFILLVPVTGLIVCCCRRNQRCGGRGSIMERRGAKWRRGLFGLLLLLLATAMLFGLVLAFISNELVHQKMDPTQTKSSSGTLASNFTDALSGLSGLLADIPIRAKNSSFSAVALLIAAVEPAVRVSVVRLRESLAGTSKADTALQAAMLGMQYLTTSHTYSESYVGQHANYSGNLVSLDKLLADLRTNLSGIDADCPFNAIQADCNLIASRLPGLRVTQDASATGLTNITELNRLLRTINETELSIRLSEAQIALNNISMVALVPAGAYTEEVRKSINSTTELAEIWSSVDHLFNTLSTFIENSTANINGSMIDPITGQPSSLDDILVNLDFIRYAVFIGVASLSTLIILLWFLGLSYGIFGEPPHEDAGCCNRRVGACFLTAGTIISFIVYAFMFLFVMALFLAGGVTDTEVCRYVTGRAGDSGYRHLDASLNQVLQSTSPELSSYSLNLVSGLLEGCSSNNASVTVALNIQNLVRASYIEARVNNFVNGTNTVLQNRRTDLVAKVTLDLNLTSVESVAREASGQPLGPFIAELSKPMIQGSETVFAAVQNISLTASRPADKQRFTALVAYIDATMRQADTLQQSQLSSLHGLQTSLVQLNSTVAGITLRLKSSHDALQTPLNIEMAINIAMLNLSSQLSTIVAQTVQHVITAAADCHNLNDLLQVLVRGPCVSFLRPFNGFWAGMGVFLLCLLPSILLAFKLANLYRKKHKHEPDYDGKCVRGLLKGLS